MGFFNLIDHENQEKLSGPIYLNGPEDEIKVNQLSLGFDIVDSIDQLNGFMDNGNQIIISYKEIQDYINSKDKATVKVVQHQSPKTGKIWNTVVFTKIEG
jgi:hypothetical protein